MKDKILIFGKGFIGTRLQEALDCRCTDRMILTLADIEEEIKKFKPKIIINCIGYIGRNVDECEFNKDATLSANSFVPILMAEAALRNNIKLVHISSGCIFKYDYKKDKPIKEDRVPDFFDLFYSRSKIYAERALEALMKKYPILIVRIRVPLDDRPSPRNLLDKLKKYKDIIDVPNTVTYLPDFVKAIRHLIKINAAGIYHVACKGALYYPDLMKAYKKYVPDFEYKVIPLKKLGLVRTNLVLSTEKLAKSGFKVRKVEEVIEECVKNYLKY
ncbi:MAG: sugar nucleotide-binding protein [Candidatus Omnitrophica bacterium]|nr:sugar nucleotide-binding protein [Candidatus Omnitrophota bacterium]